MDRVGVEPATGQPTVLTLTYRLSARTTGLTVFEHQLSSTMEPGSWQHVAPSAWVNIGLDPVTGDWITQARFGVSPGETQKFVRIRLGP